MSKSTVIWLTGLPCSGKTTLARATADALRARGRRAYVLDGDVLRGGLCIDLGFSQTQRDENVRRLCEVARILADAELTVLVAAISPDADMRSYVRRRVELDAKFVEVHCAADLATCEVRDVKGMYAKARAGRLRCFTGIDSPYDAPCAPDVVCETGIASVHDCVAQILSAVIAE